MANTLLIRRSATPSAVPTTGQLALGELALNTYDGKLYMKKNVSGTESIVQIGAGGGSSVTVSTTAPSSPSAGDLWFDSTNGKLKVYYNDGTSSQWVDAFVGTVGATGATGATGASGTIDGTTVTTFTGLLKGNGSNISAATAGTDYLAPAAIGSTVQAYDGDLAAIAALSDISSGLLRKTGTNAWSIDSTSYLSSASIGSSVQGWSPDLDAIDALSGTGILKRTGINTWAFDTATYTVNPMTTTGDMIYSSPGATPARLAGSTSASKRFLSQTGDGTNSAAPAWSAVSKTDVGLGSVENTALSTWAGSTNITTVGTLANDLGVGVATDGTQVLHVGACTTAKANIELVAGTLMTTPDGGSIEYDGSCFYLTPNGNGRAVNLQEQVVLLGSTNTLTSQTAAQPLFDNVTAGGAVSLPVGTYQFECFYSLSAMSGNNSFGFAIAAGTAVIAAQYWTATANKAALATATAATVSFNTAANTALTASNTTTTGYAFIKGMIRISTAGTIVPQVSLGGAAAAVVGAGSYFKISALSPVSAAATNISIGNWS